MTYRVLQSHFMMTNCVCVRAAGGAFLVDPGVFEDEVSRLGEIISGESSLVIAYTHFDFDHIIDPPLQAGLSVMRWASSRSRERDTSEILADWVRFDGAFYMPRLRPRTIPVCDRLISSPLSAIGACIGEVVALQVPGHSADSMAYIIPGAHLAAVGDMMSDVEPPSATAGAAPFLASLAALRAELTACGVTAVVPGHGRIAEGRQAWMARLDADQRYLEDLVAMAAAVSAHEMGEDCADAVEMAARDAKFMGYEIAPWHRSLHLRNLRAEIAAGDLSV